MKKALSVALILVIVTVLFPLSQQLFAASTITITSPGIDEAVLPEANDYATLRFSDPWDMSNSEDGGLKYERMRNIYFSSGKLNATTYASDGSFWPQWGGYKGSYPNGREGAANKINTSVYRRFSVKMYSSAEGRAKVWGFRNQTLTDRSWQYLMVKQGWHIYQLDLDSAKWYGWVLGMRFDPINLKDQKVVIDWMRLTKKRNDVDVNINWTDEGQDAAATVYLDENNSGYDGAAIEDVTSANGDNSLTVNTSGLAPGNYYVYIKKGSDYSAYSPGPIHINRMPVFRILDPDKTGGTDWAAKYVGRWDMSNYSDLSYTRNIINRRISGGAYHAYNANNDSFMHFQTGRYGISSGYRYLTFRYKYDGSFSLRRGTMSRIVWKPYGVSGLQVSDDIVTYDRGWHDYTIDLTKIRLDEGRYGWRGRTNMFRLDPNEDPQRRRFYIDYFKLAAPDSCSSTFNIKYRNWDSNDSRVNLKLYYDLDRTFGNGNEKLITTRDIASGNSYYRWRHSSSLKRSVWIYGELDDGKNTVGYYSTGPLRVY